MRKSIKKQTQENIRDELICEEEFPNFGEEDPYSLESIKLSPDKQILKNVTNQLEPS